MHEIKSNGRLKELCHASGGDCGGMSIDNAFIQIIVRIIGAPLICVLKQEEPDAYLDILREFEMIKRKIKTDTTGKMNVTFPCATITSLCEQHQNKTLNSMIQSSPFSSKIELKRDKMKFDADFMKSLFEETINNIVSLVTDVLRKPAAKSVPLLLLVGGFADCPLVQSAMKTNFPDKHIIIPEEAVLSVLKGAVLLGHKPDYIASRVMRVSYGTDVTVLFDPDNHEQHRKYTIDGEDRCSDIFSEIIQKNESVAVGTIVSHNYTTDTKYQSKLYIAIYGSNKKKPTYVDEDCCFLIGKVKIDIPSPTRKKRLVSVEYIFGNTEISITATDDLYGIICEAAFTL